MEQLDSVLSPAVGHGPAEVGRLRPTRYTGGVAASLRPAMSSALRPARIFIAGHRGMVGSAIVRALHRRIATEPSELVV
ncbi:MAG: hypothetical protein ACKODG_10930, partial [Betaproteobacteria bacterium]